MTSDKKRRPNQNKSPVSGSEKPGLAARQAAAKILSAVVDRKISLDGMLDGEHGNPAYRDLSAADKALTRAIVSSALRHLPQIEAIIGSLLKSPLPDGARALHHGLNVAAAQILYLDVPDHSAVDLAVEQANIDPRNRRFASLVNAVLRRLVREKEELVATIGASVPALPAWFFDRLVESYGEETARRIADAQMAPAPVDLTVKSDPEGWAKKLGGKVLPTGSVRLDHYDGAISDLEGYADGQWWVQDAAAAIPARLFGDIAGQRVVDLCAAPGGKTAQLIAAGADVTALDQSASRLKRLKGNLLRLGMQAELHNANAGDFTTQALFDVALLDAPCSSTGTARRHPDIPWTKSFADIEKLAKVQENLLRHALTLVKPGGRVVFSNCSLDPLEGEEMVARLVSQGVCERVPVEKDGLPGLEEAVTSLGEVRTTPAMLHLSEDPKSNGLDGFFAVVLKRV